MTFKEAMHTIVDIKARVDTFTDAATCEGNGDSTETCYAILALSTMMDTDNLQVRTTSEDAASKTV